LRRQLRQIPAKPPQTVLLNLTAVETEKT